MILPFCLLFLLLAELKKKKKKKESNQPSRAGIRLSDTKQLKNIKYQMWDQQIHSKKTILNIL